VDSGLKDELVLGDPDAPRFVLWNGKLRPVPGKPTDLPFFDLMSIGGKLRAGFGALGIRPPPPVCSLLISFFCLIIITLCLMKYLELEDK
jgi:oxygen-dependent protoporphyrinogen oxidase